MCSDGWPASPYQNKTDGMECGGVVRTFGMAAGRIRDPWMPRSLGTESESEFSG